MKKTLALFLVLAMALTFFTACGDVRKDGTVGKTNVNFNDYYKSTIEMSDQSGYTTAETINLPENAQNIAIQGMFFRYSDENQLHYYNVSENRVVLSVDIGATDTTADGEFIRVIETDTAGEKSTKIYNEKGSLLVSESGELTFSVATDGFTLGEKFYVVDDGAVKKSYKIPPFLSLSEIDFTEDYAIKRTNTEAVFYNDAFEAVAIYALPSTAVRSNMMLLDDGKLLVEYTMTLDPNAKKYDLYYNGEKYELHHELFDPESGKTKVLDLGILISSVRNRRNNDDSFDKIYTENVKNIVEYRAIVNGITDGSVYHYVLMDENGKLGASLDCFVEGQKDLIRPLNNDHYYVKTQAGYAILDTKGEVVRTVPAIGTAKAYGFYHDEKVYNTDFTPALDLSTANGSVFYTDYNFLLYSKTPDGTVRFYRYDKTGEHEIVLPEDAKIYTSPMPIYELPGCYKVTYYTDNAFNRSTDVYNASGNLLFTALYYGNEYSCLVQTENACIVQYTNMEGKSVYIRLSK